MDLNDFERDLFLDLAFFAGNHSFIGQELRPLSLASYKLVQMMGLKILDDDIELDPQAETSQIAVYIWLHKAPIVEICEAVWSGTWREMLAGFPEPSPVVILAFRTWRVRIVAMLAASAIKPKNRPKQSGDDTPKDVVGPSKFAFTVAMIANFTHYGRQAIMWEIFLPEAMQYYHAALRWQGVWTVRPGLKLKPEEFDDLTPDWLKGDDVDTSENA